MGKLSTDQICATPVHIQSQKSYCISSCNANGEGNLGKVTSASKVFRLKQEHEGVSIAVSPDKLVPRGRFLTSVELLNTTGCFWGLRGPYIDFEAMARGTFGFS